MSERQPLVIIINYGRNGRQSTVLSRVSPVGRQYYLRLFRCLGSFLPNKVSS